MKKFFIIVLRALTALIVPAIFIGLLLFSLQQSFTTGLLLLFVAMVFQIVLTSEFEDELDWRKEWWGNSLCQARYEINKIELSMVKLLNILFNLTKVLSVSAVLVFCYLNFPTVGPLGIIGFIIAAIVMTIILIQVTRHNLSSCRGKFWKLTSIVVYVTIIFFFYLYSDSQVMWIFVILLFTWQCLFRGWRQVKKSFKRERENFFLILAVAIIAVISTIIQFWGEISSFCKINWINLFNYKILFGIDLGTFILGIIAFAVLAISVFYFHARKLEKVKLLKIEERRKEEEAAKEEKRILERKAIDSTIMELEKIKLALETRPLTKNEVLFLVRNHEYYEFNVPFLSLGRIDWQDFFTVCTVKRQIVWRYNLSEILTFLNRLYKKSYEDRELKLIIQTINELNNFLAPYTKYVGYARVNEILATNTPNIPK